MKKAARPIKTSIVVFRAEPALVERLRALAEREGRPLSSYITRVLQSHVGRSGR